MCRHGLVRCLPCARADAAEWLELERARPTPRRPDDPMAPITHERAQQNLLVLLASLADDS
jgi:hypothetical protein